MHKKTKQNIAAFLSVSALGATALWWNSLYQDLYGRFPNLDRKIVRKTFRRFMWKGLTQQHDFENLTDAQMDRKFLLEYAAVAAETLKK